MPVIKPKHYNINIHPDLSTFTFTGSCGIHFQVDEAVTEVTLDTLELEINTCMVKLENEGKKEIEQHCEFHLKPKEEKLIIVLPFSCKGEFILFITYKGEINNKMAGFYRSSYKTGKERKYIGVTQFEESDARRAFPCMDHPLWKARFTVEMVIDSHLQAISNEDSVKEEELPEEKRLIRFKTTPKMSTYLLFFGVGAFEMITDSKDSRIRLYTVPGKIEYGTYGIEFGRKALSFCENYYDIPYPLTKMDLIAVPDFAFGAMENWGAVTFRENLLLYYPGITSRKGELRICEVIAHEIVHMWFGNLVTPSDWKFLWLNESFATFFGFGIVDHYYPDWEIWDQFISEVMDKAMERDALKDTIAIEIPGGEHIVINISTAPIIYSKGGSILRQMKEYIGDESFKKGLHAYLYTHSYGNTSSIDFWQAFEESSEIPVVDLMKTWIEQPGFPLVTVKRDGKSLGLHQRRFTYLTDEFGQNWNIPLTIRLFYDDKEPEDRKVLFTTQVKQVSIPESVTHYKINPGHTGFYRVHYKDDKNLNALKNMVKQKTLSPGDRWGCENDMYALVSACELSFTNYLEFLLAYNNEDTYLPLTSIADHLTHSYSVLSEKWYDSIRETGIRLYESALTAIGCEPGDKESFTTALLRESILYNAVFFGSENIKDFCEQQFLNLSKGVTVHPDILSSIMKAGAFLLPQKAWDVLIHRIESTESEHDRMNVLSGLSCFSKKEYIDRALDYILKKVPSRNKHIPLSAMPGNPYALPFLWEWYTSHIEILETLHPIHYERIIASFIPYCGIEREDEVNDFFTTYTAKKDLAKQAISLAIERLAIHTRMRKANG